MNMLGGGGEKRAEGSVEDLAVTMVLFKNF